MFFSKKADDSSTIPETILYSTLGLASGYAAEQLWRAWKRKTPISTDWRETVWDIGKVLDKPDGVSALDWARKVKVEFDLLKLWKLQIDRILGTPEGADSVKWAEEFVAKKRSPENVWEKRANEAVAVEEGRSAFVNKVFESVPSKADAVAEDRANRAEQLVKKLENKLAALEAQSRTSEPAATLPVAINRYAQLTGKSEAWKNTFLKVMATAKPLADEAEAAQAKLDAEASNQKFLANLNTALGGYKPVSVFVSTVHGNLAVSRPEEDDNYVGRGEFDDCLDNACDTGCSG